MLNLIWSKLSNLKGSKVFYEPLPQEKGSSRAKNFFTTILVWSLILLLISPKLTELMAESTCKHERANLRNLSKLYVSYGEIVYTIPLKNPNNALLISNQIVAISYESGLNFYNISDIKNPSLISTIPLAGTLGETAVMKKDIYGMLYILYASINTIYMIDVLDPARPTYYYAITMDIEPVSMAFTPDYAYFYVSGSSKLKVFTTGSHTYPTLSHTVSTTSTCYNLSVLSTNYLYGTIPNTGLCIYRIATRTNPTFAANYNIGGTLSASYHETYNYILVLSSVKTAYLITLANPESPSISGRIENLDAVSMNFANNIIYFSNGNKKTTIYDASTPSKIFQKGVLYGDNIFLLSPISSSAFLAFSSDAVRVYQQTILTPTKSPIPPMRLRAQFTGRQYAGMAFGLRNTLYVGFDFGINNYDVFTDPLYPYSLSSTGVNGIAYVVRFSADYSRLFGLGFGTNQFRAYSYTNHQNPSAIFSIQCDKCKDFVVTSNDVAYFVEEGVGVNIRGLSNYGSSYGYLSGDCIPYKNIVWDNTSEVLYFSSQDNQQLCVYNTTNRYSPTLITKVSGANPIAILGTYLFTCSGNLLSIYQTATKTNITKLSSIKTQNCQGLSFSTDKNYAYLTDGSGGINYMIFPI